MSLSWYNFRTALVSMGFQIPQVSSLRATKYPKKEDFDVQDSIPKSSMYKLLKIYLGVLLTFSSTRLTQRLYLWRDPSSGDSLSAHSDIDIQAYTGLIPPDISFTSTCVNQNALVHIAKSFKPSSYQPPFWARNNHVHTISASGDFELMIRRDKSCEIPYIRERWETPDGSGQIDIDFLVSNSLNSNHRSKYDSHATDTFQCSNHDESEGKATIGINFENSTKKSSKNKILSITDNANFKQWAMDNKNTGRKLIVLLHGLESSSRHPLTKKFAEAFSRRGYDVAALNFRGCAEELGAHPVGYHLGYTDDLKFVLEEIQKKYPGMWDKVYLSGFSLGANVIINFLGKEGDLAMREYNVMGAAVACAPFNPEGSVRALEGSRIGQYLYVTSFINILRVKAEAHSKLYPTAFDSNGLSQIRTFSEFNAKVVSPLYGFKTVEEYYELVDARRYISQVQVPLLVVNARDDPLICPESLPEPHEVDQVPVKLVYHDKGGHCAFLTSRKNPQKGEKEVQEGRWLPTELARFVDHVDTFMSSRVMMKNFESII